MEGKNAKDEASGSRPSSAGPGRVVVYLPWKDRTFREATALQPRLQSVAGDPV